MNIHKSQRFFDVNRRGPFWNGDPGIQSFLYIVTLDTLLAQVPEWYDTHGKYFLWIGCKGVVLSMIEWALNKVLTKLLAIEQLMMIYFS